MIHGSSIAATTGWVCLSGLEVLREEYNEMEEPESGAKKVLMMKYFNFMVRSVR